VQHYYGRPWLRRWGVARGWLTAGFIGIVGQRAMAAGLMITIVVTVSAPDPIGVGGVTPRVSSRYARPGWTKPVVANGEESFIAVPSLLH
jgi:hypothetical protein